MLPLGPLDMARTRIRQVRGTPGGAQSVGYASAGFCIHFSCGQEHPRAFGRAGA